MPLPSSLPLKRYLPLFRRVAAFVFPASEVTIRSPMSLDDARLHLRVRAHSGFERTTHPGIFADRRHYQGQFTDDHLRVRGPFGKRKWPIITDGVLRPDGNGSALELKMHLALIHPLSALLLLAPFSCIIVIASGEVMALPCIIVPFIALYAISIANLQVEAEVITEILGDILSTEQRK